MDKYFSLVSSSYSKQIFSAKQIDRGYDSQEEESSTKDILNNQFNEKSLFDIFNRQQQQKPLQANYKTLTELNQMKKNFEIHQQLKSHISLHQGDEEHIVEEQTQSARDSKNSQEIIFTAKSKMDSISISRINSRFNIDLSILNVPDDDLKAVIRERSNTIFEHPFKSLIFGPMIPYVQFEAHLTLIYKGLTYAINCLKRPSEKYIKSKQIELPKVHNSKGYVLFLDLDETLMHSCSLNENPDVIIKIQDEAKCEQIQGIKLRPYCIEFIQNVSKYWNIYAFTASTQRYAQSVVNLIDPNKKYFEGIFDRSHCMQTRNGFFIKDLRIFKKLKLEKTILVDNLAHSFGFQIENGVPILEWHSDKKDYQLQYLVYYLNQATQYKDVRIYNRENLQLMKLYSQDFEELC